jgi:hypothetical protein
VVHLRHHGSHVPPAPLTTAQGEKSWNFRSRRPAGHRSSLTNLAHPRSSGSNRGARANRSGRGGRLARSEGGSGGWLETLGGGGGVKERSFLSPFLPRSTAAVGCRGQLLLLMERERIAFKKPRPLKGWGRGRARAGINYCPRAFSDLVPGFVAYQVRYGQEIRFGYNFFLVYYRQTKNRNSLYWDKIYIQNKTTLVINA